MKENVVCVYMSTYNGEKYLRQQIDSILGQKGVRVKLCVRDDGSSDSTVTIINEYIKKGQAISLVTGSNIGFMRSFATLSHIEVNADFYAYADQDDVWELNKLENAIKLISKHSGPILYGGNIYVTDEKLENRKKLYNNDFLYKADIIENGFALGYNAYACSMVWNSELQKLLYRYFPNNILSQDVYISILAGAVGKIIVDETPYILHRIHDSNTAGIEKRILKRLQKGYKLYWGKERRSVSNIVKEIIREYEGEISKLEGSEGRKLLFLVAIYKNSFRVKTELIKEPMIKRLKGTRKLLMYLYIIFNKL